MCGRFSLELPAKTIAQFFLAQDLPEQSPRYNIAPTQDILGIFEAPQNGKRIGAPFHWGLIPTWAKDRKIANRLTNARAETLREKPSFRGAYKYRRCLIPVSGFFEWKRQGKGKQPYYFKAEDDQPLAFAGLWEHWSGPMGEEIMSCTMVTTEANRLMAPIHHRMPVILDQKDHGLWLDTKMNDSKTLDPLLKPYGDEGLVSYPVSTFVNYSGNQGKQCIEPISLSEGGDNNSQLDLFQ